MGSANTARRRVQEQARPPDAAAVLAELGRINAEGDAIHRRMRRLDGEVSRITARLDELAAGSDPERFALLADKLANRLSVLVTELMADAAHCEESRRQAEALAPLLAFTPAMFEAAVLEGRRREAEERDQAPRARPRARHAKRHLRLAGNVAVKATAVAAVAATATTMIAAHDSASVHYWAAAAPAGHAALHRMAPDRAALVPSWSPRPRFSPSPRPSAAVASASPVPTAVPGLPFPSLPAGPPPSSPPPPVVAPAPVLAVPRLLDLGATTRGPLTLTAGPQAVTWTVGTADGITVLAGGRPVTGGTLAAGQELDLTVMAPLGEGWVYVSAGQQTWTWRSRRISGCLRWRCRSEVPGRGVLVLPVRAGIGDELPQFHRADEEPPFTALVAAGQGDYRPHWTIRGLRDVLRSQVELGVLAAEHLERGIDVIAGVGPGGLGHGLLVSGQAALGGGLGSHSAEQYQRQCRQMPRSPVLPGARPMNDVRTSGVPGNRRG